MRKNLMNARKKMGLTQLQTAQELQITIRHYNSLEAGTSDGSIKIWKKLKVILNASSIDYLLEQEAGTQKKPDGNRAMSLHQNNSIQK